MKDNGLVYIETAIGFGQIAAKMTLDWLNPNHIINGKRLLKLFDNKY